MTSSDRDRVLLVGLADGTPRAGATAREARARLREVPDGARCSSASGASGARCATACPAAAASSRRPSPPTGDRRATLAALGPTRRPRGRARGGPARARPVAPGGPSVVDQAAALAQSGRPRPAASSGTVLDASVDGVAFPDWSGEFGWHAARRATRHARRPAHDDGLLRAHGSPDRVHDPAGRARRSARGLAGRAPRRARDRALPRRATQTIAVFERDGRTCVLAGHV